MKMNKTTYKNILLLALLLLPFLAMSQKATREQIDNIRHDKRFLSSTETYAETEAEAIDEALKKLAYIVNMYIRDSTNLKIDVNQINLKEKEERLTFQEDGFFYVLIYVPKSVILELCGSHSSVKEENPKHQITLLPPTPIETPLPSEISSKTADGAKDLTEWQRDAIEELLLSGNLHTAMAKLQQMKDFFKVKRWGAGKSCPDAAKAYWIIFDDNQNLVTILGSGTNKRWDFYTGKISSLDNYKNMNAIWFYLAK